MMKITKLSHAAIFSVLGMSASSITAFAAPGWTMEKFNNVSGSAVSNLVSSASFYSAPTPVVLTSSEIPTNTGQDYGTRIRGYIIAPVTGSYIFWESGDDAVQLFLSPDENPALKQLIAFHSGSTSLKQWDKYGSQKSRMIPMEAGRKYYIEMLHKEGAGSDHLAIAWTIPGNDRTLIPLSAMETFDISAPNTTEGLTHQIFENIAGSYVADLTSASRFPHSPDHTSIMASGQGPVDAGDNMGTRTFGWIVPQVSGDYNFWVCGDSRLEVFLSPTGNPADKQQIASCGSATAPQEWTKTTSQKSRVLSLTAGSAYYIEILHKESTGSDHFAVAWTLPSGVFEVLPSTVLRTFSAHPTDLDNDQIADSQEVTLGLDPTISADGYFDLDGDAIPNFLEYSQFSHPAQLDSVAGYLNDDAWFNISGDKLNAASYKIAATRPRDKSYFMTVSQSSDVGDNYVRRYRGFITAPLTGQYQFWLTCDDDGDFFLSTSASKFGLVQLIRGEVLGGSTRGFDLDPSQKSSLITLEAGQKYYFEMWHKESTMSGNAALAWKIPSGTRQVIPSYYLSSFALDADDQDDDGLSDAFETVNGLSITDNGKYLGSTDGAYGDLDGDGLTNAEEQKHNTKAHLIDSDDDGVSDYDEVNFFGSATLANDIGAFTEVSTIAGSAYTSSVGEWTNLNNTALQKCRRGSVTYPVTVPSSGIHAFKFTIQSRVDGAKNEQHDFHLKLNGKHLVHKTITILPDGTANLSVLSPWLQAGETYNLELFVDNSYNWRRVSINQLQVLKAGGTDSNSNGLADWTEIRIYGTNGLDTPGVIHSRTSPAVIEGKAKHFNLLSTNTPSPQAVPNGRFFTEVPLTVGISTELNFSFENQSLSQTASVNWLPTNLKVTPSLTIREGDSLLLTAFNDAENASLESYTFNVNGTSVSNSSNLPTAQLFATAGTYPVTTTHTAADGSITNYTCIVTVLGKINISAPSCLVGYYRNWTHPALPNGATLTVDSQVQSVPAGIANTLTLTTATPINQPVIIKASDGLILGSGEIKSASFRSSDQTGITVLESFPTYQKLQMPVIVYGDLGTMQIQCKIIIGGVTYTDGTISKTINQSNFDVNHQYSLFYNKPLNAHSNCHQFIFGY